MDHSLHPIDLFSLHPIKEFDPPAKMLLTGHCGKWTRVGKLNFILAPDAHFHAAAVNPFVPRNHL